MRLKVVSEQPLTRQRRRTSAAETPIQRGAVKCKVGLTENGKIKLRQKTKKERP